MTLVKRYIIWIMHQREKDRNQIAIIGNGCAGAECVKALRASGYSGKIHLFAAGKWPIYNPILTTYYVADKISFEQLFPYAKGDEFYRLFEVEVHSASPVVALDAEKRIVANQTGFELYYDKCLIASGASPSKPPIEGIDSDKVYVMRTVEDAIRLKQAMAKKPRKALVVGGSLIGIKLVELFHSAGMEICLADAAYHLFPANAQPECAGIIEDRLRGMGIKLRFKAVIRKIEDTPVGIKAYFDNSSDSEEADLVAICTGVRANTDFIDRRQVEVKQGVLVDEYMQTNAPGLYAAGDVAQGMNLLTGKPEIIGLWANARCQGRTAGRNMAGIGEIFSGNIPHHITHFLGIDFVGIGEIREHDRIEKRYDHEKCQQLFWKDGRLIGANLVGTYAEAGVIKSAILRGLNRIQINHGNLLPAIQDLLIRKTIAEVEEV